MSASGDEGPDKLRQTIDPEGHEQHYTPPEDEAGVTEQRAGSLASYSTWNALTPTDQQFLAMLTRQQRVRRRFPERRMARTLASCPRSVDGDTTEPRYEDTKENTVQTEVEMVKAESAKEASARALVSLPSDAEANAPSPRNQGTKRSRDQMEMEMEMNPPEKRHDAKRQKTEEASEAVRPVSSSWGMRWMPGTWQGP